MAEYVPMYSTHGHGRKTHIAADESGASLCGIEKRYPDLLWTTGSVYYDIDSQFFIDDPDRPRGCRRCGQIYRKSL